MGQKRMLEVVGYMVSPSYAPDAASRPTNKMIFEKLSPGQSHTLETIHQRCIEDGDCWIWQAGKSHGTPMLAVQKKVWPVRRYIYEVIQGKTASKALLVTYSCDRPDCVNPDHIQAVTRKTLQQRAAKRTKYADDRVRNQKLAKAAQARSHLDWDKVRAIRAMDDSDKAIARQLGMSFSAVNDIRKHRTWKEINNPFFGLLAA